MPRAIEPPRPEKEVDWGGFQLAMLGDQAYQRTSETTAAQRAVSRVETYFSAHVENWPLAAILWGEMIRACPTGQGPTDTETEKWNRIAQATNMPIEFTAEGYLTPKTENE